MLAIRIYRISGITVCSEISDYMQKNKAADIVDIIQGSVLIKEKDRACEFNISTKKVIVKLVSKFHNPEQKQRR